MTLTGSVALTQYRVPKECTRCRADIDPSGNRMADARRSLCDRCRDLNRVLTHLRQAQAVAERLSYDSQLAARIRLAVKAAQR